MIDWTTAQRVAELVAGSPPTGRLPADIEQLAEDSAARITAYTGLTPSAPLPPPEGVTRAMWIRANLATMRPLVDPLSERMGEGLGALSGPVRSASGLLLGAEVGALTGYLSQRVMGQYELSLLDADAATRLLLVTPNLADAASNLGLDHDELVHWVTVHEVTHAIQFSFVPWLRALAGLLRELIDSMHVEIDTGGLLRLPAREDLRALVETVREHGLLRLVVGDERQALIDRVQAAMSLIEGHAEHVMDAVGAEVLPTLDRLREALDRRRTERPAVFKLIERLLGLELKMRQYEVGKRFVDGVVEGGGMAALNRAWSAPELLPTLAELQDPGAWRARTHVPAVTK